MMKKIIFLIIFGIILTAASVGFFWPKKCGRFGMNAIEKCETKCVCYGLLSRIIPPGGGPYTCFGICDACQKEVCEPLRK